MYKLHDVKVIDRPGYFGKMRPEKEAAYSRLYGGDWFECWQVNDLILTFEEAVMLYDDAYWMHLCSDKRLTDWLCTHRDVYDSDESNVLCGIHHSQHAVPRHLQDVSIRRALLRMGRWFAGDELLQVRGPETKGHLLMPGLVPFHLPKLLIPPGNESGPLKSWAPWSSVEGFWQRSKTIITTR